MIRVTLLALPIHRTSYDRYYDDQKAYIEREKKKLETTFGKPYKNLAANTRKGFERSWWWPPWYYNDLVGFVEVGLDQSSRMAGETFLKRKHFRRDDPSRTQGGTGPVAAHEILAYCEINPVTVNGANNAAYLAACEQVIRAGRRLVRQRVRGVVVTLPSWPLSCVDFVAAVAAAKPRW